MIFNSEFLSFSDLAGGYLLLPISILESFIAFTLISLKMCIENVAHLSQGVGLITNQDLEKHHTAGRWYGDQSK